MATETKTEHTPGPWKVDKLDDDNYGVSAGWVDIATVHNREDDPVDKANAQLVAAAPTLLEALKALTKEVGTILDYERQQGTGFGDLDDAHTEACAAITAAGES